MRERLDNERAWTTKDAKVAKYTKGFRSFRVVSRASVLYWLSCSWCFREPVFFTGFRVFRVPGSFASPHP